MPYRISARPSVPEYHHSWWMKLKRWYMRKYLAFNLWGHKNPIWPFLPLQPRDRLSSRVYRLNQGYASIEDYLEDVLAQESSKSRWPSPPQPIPAPPSLLNKPLPLTDTYFSKMKFVNPKDVDLTNIIKPEYQKYYDPRMDPRGVPDKWKITVNPLLEDEEVLDIKARKSPKNYRERA